jgi:hypothetical protein
MTQTARITDAGRWMPTKPTATLRAVVLAFVATGLAAVLMVQFQWTHLQRFYVKGYLKSSITARFNLSPRPYDQVQLHAKGRHYFAASDDVTVDDQNSVVLTPTAVAAGAEGVSLVSLRVPNAEMQRLLRAYIYDGHGLLWYARGPAVVGILALLAVLVWSIPTDVRRARERRHGAHLRGSELVAIAEFNRRIREA